MGNQFDSMLKGLTQAIEYVQGDETKGRSKEVKLKKLEVVPLKDYSKEELKNIRLQNNLTQKNFADCLGVTKKTVESWERGRNKPSGASVRMFQIMEKNTHILEECGIAKQA
jgi:putative transcriptional regulator